MVGTEPAATLEVSISTYSLKHVCTWHHVLFIFLSLLPYFFNVLSKVLLQCVVLECPNRKMDFQWETLGLSPHLLNVTFKLSQCSKTQAQTQGMFLNKGSVFGVLSLGQLQVMWILHFPPHLLLSLFAGDPHRMHFPASPALWREHEVQHETPLSQVGYYWWRRELFITKV